MWEGAVCGQKQTVTTGRLSAAPPPFPQPPVLRSFHPPSLQVLSCLLAIFLREPLLDWQREALLVKEVGTIV